MERNKAFKDFRKAITARPRDGLPCITIGGQAVNFWAEQSEGLVPVLTTFRPYTSRDLDLVAHQKNQLEAIKAVVPLKCTEVEQAYGGLDRAAFQEENGETVIQVLSGMYSISDPDLLKHTRTVILADEVGQQYDARIADLPVLLKDKIELSLASESIRNPSDKENDRRHLKMLIMCVQGRLRNLYVALLKGEKTERDLINPLKEYREILFTERAQSVSQLDPGIVWTQAIPEEFLTLDLASFPKLHRYFTNEILPILGEASPGE
jgi:hypothetical protein